MSWVTKFDNTFWRAGAGGGGGTVSWTGSSWDIAVAGGSPVNIDIAVVISGINNNWQVGFRPTSVRITAHATSSQSIELDTFDTGGSDYLNAGNVAPAASAVTTSPQQFVFPLDFTPGLDIESIQAFQASYGTWTLHITNIEFDTGSSPTAFWQNKVKCTETDA
jgi:hypothetical protein